ncbi:MAG: type II toxin-antitoxin system RelB/DinJ family antitoxin [Clostridia bacterium]|nr:type II toxin-antitoxin system RelB/DinJ family antitoxin [Clostridia bacterium]
MATPNINIRVDTELKQSAERLFDDLGLSMTSAITMFLKSAVLNNGIPFEVRSIPNAETRAALAEYTTMKESPDSYKRYDSFSDLVAELTEV